MKKALFVFFSGLAVAVAVTLVSARSPSHVSAADAAPSLAPNPLSARAQVIDASSAEPRQVAVIVFGPHYGSSPRIIHVPQGPEQESRARANEGEEAVAPIEDDAADAAPPPSRYRVIPLPRRSDVAAPKREAAPAPQRPSDIAPVARHNDAPILQKLTVAPAAPLSQRQDEPAEASVPPAGDAAVSDNTLTPIYPTPRYGQAEPKLGTAKK